MALPRIGRAFSKERTELLTRFGIPLYASLAFNRETHPPFLRVLASAPSFLGGGDAATARQAIRA